MSHSDSILQDSLTLIEKAFCKLPLDPVALKQMGVRKDATNSFLAKKAISFQEASLPPTHWDLHVPLGRENCLPTSPHQIVKL